MQLTIRPIGNSTGVILPKALLAKLGVQNGDALFVTENHGGGITLRPHDPVFEAQMAAAREGMADYRHALQKLAE